MQTATQQLIELLAHNNILDHKALSSNKRLYDLYLRLKAQAETKEKQQKIDFAKHCLDRALDLDIRTAYSNVEQYYTNIQNRQTKEKLSDFGIQGDESIETYGSKGSDVCDYCKGKGKIFHHEFGQFVKCVVCTEISDEEIEKEASHYIGINGSYSFTMAIKWYREQLKKKQ